MSKVADAQSYFPSGTTVAEMGLDFSNEFRGIYSDERLGNILAVGPMQAYVGLAIRNGHLAPAAEVAELREQLATARADGEWLLSWERVHHNRISNATDAYRIREIAERMVGRP